MRNNPCKIFELSSCKLFLLIIRRKTENTYYSHCRHKSKRKVQIPVQNSWSDLGKKASLSQHRFQHLPEPLSEREKK